jgi:hypothetical protein
VAPDNERPQARQYCITKDTLLLLSPHTPADPPHHTKHLSPPKPPLQEKLSRSSEDESTHADAKVGRGPSIQWIALLDQPLLSSSSLLHLSLGVCWRAWPIKDEAPWCTLFSGGDP